MTGQTATSPLADRLLDWYGRHHRDLPWRIAPTRLAAGAIPDPYRVWLSEIMLQQTTVEAVKAYFTAFVTRWPSVQELAGAETDDVMRAWAGLGYYSRARNLKACAEAVVETHGGVFPSDHKALLALPGIGPYTAAAISAIAFGGREPVIDGNIERVVSRLRRIATPLPTAKREIAAALERVMPYTRTGDFAQALMDLGATICTPRRPACILCPVSEDCEAMRHGDMERYPVKLPKPEKPQRRGAAFVALNRHNEILLEQRPPSGLLGGMTQVPTTGWTARIDGATDAGAAPFPARWQEAGTVRHVFTHFVLDLTVYRGQVEASVAGAEQWWTPLSQVGNEALPTVMAKVIETACPSVTRKAKPD